jgi:hypothetical protein
VTGCCEHGDEPSTYDATELVRLSHLCLNLVGVCILDYVPYTSL